MEATFTLPGGIKLFGKIDTAGQNPKGVIILIHGLGEHISRYDHWSRKFVEQGYCMIRADLPGHGKSDGKRGHVNKFGLFREIIGLLIDRASADFPGLPVILYGHSLGGTIVLSYMVSGAEGIKLGVVTSPWIRLAFEPPKGKMVLASVVKSIMPSLVQPTGLVAEHLSHDPAVVKAYTDDPLVHSKISVSLFSGVYNASREILERGADIKVPVLLLHGKDDLITSPGGSSELAEKSSKIDIRLWEGGYHELHNEPFNGEVFAEIIGWVNNHI